MGNRVAINGFGRIGRVILRILDERRKLSKTKIEVAAINDLASPKDLAHLFKYDSVHGRFSGQISCDDNILTVEGQQIKICSTKDPAELPWADLGIDVVVESTGHFLTREKASRHLSAGAKKVLMTAPGKGELPDATICFGINNHDLKPQMKLISTASCTTNCIAPVAKVINDKFGIKKASVTTIHSYTNDQHVLDMAHSDPRRARAAALSMIPTTTGAAKAISLVLPELSGKFQGMAIRVPTPNVSLIDFVAQVEKGTTANEINLALKEAAQNQFPGILGYNDEPLVSIDMVGTSCSSIVDAPSTMVSDNDLIKVLAWYDNEWGFANRAVDLIESLIEG